MYILFDIGGTKMRIAGSFDKEHFEQVKITKTPISDFEEGMRFFESSVREIAGSEKIDAVFGGIAGPLDREKNFLANAPNIPGWIGKPLKERVTAMCDAPVTIENDSSLAGVGEAVFGAGRGYDIVGYVGVGTGVGGGRIAEGMIDKNCFGFEPGHHIVNYEKGESIESLISGTAVFNRTGKNAADISQEDPIWDELARILAVGLNNISVFWSPEAIVIGGSMVIGTPRISFEKVESYFKEIMTIFPETPVLKRAELKDEGGLYGALALARNVK